VPRTGRKPRKNYRSEARATPEVVLAVARLGKRVRQLRNARKLTQERLAEDAKLAAKHLQDIERGRTNPTLATLVGLAKALGVELHVLFAEK
jgi:transcriptional regulator with XRE-family HTH domain